MPQPWSALFQINQNPLMALNLEGIPQAMADRAPAEGVNSVTWLLRHILAYRIETLAALGASFEPEFPEPKAMPELMAAINEIQTALAQAFDAVKDWTVVKSHPALPAPMPLDQIVGAFLVHEAYHAGQFAIARKLLGLPGVLKEPKKVAHA